METSRFLKRARKTQKIRVSKEKAAENRERIIEVASKLFLERGFDGVGVADLMKSAGRTHGGFYGNFESKNDLIPQACRRALEQSLDTLKMPWNMAAQIAIMRH